MQRLKDERGAVAVMVALLMVPLIGFAAIAIDVAAMWAERQQLQTAPTPAPWPSPRTARKAPAGTRQTAQALAVVNVDGEPDHRDVSR